MKISKKCTLTFLFNDMSLLYWFLMITEVKRDVIWSEYEHDSLTNYIFNIQLHDNHHFLSLQNEHTRTKKKLNLNKSRKWQSFQWKLHIRKWRFYGNQRNRLSAIRYCKNKLFLRRPSTFPQLHFLSLTRMYHIIKKIKSSTK